MHSNRLAVCTTIRGIKKEEDMSINVKNSLVSSGCINGQRSRYIHTPAHMYIHVSGETLHDQGKKQWQPTNHLLW